MLSFVPSHRERRSAGAARRSTTPLRAGIDRAAHESAGGGLTGSVVAFLLRELLAQPVEWFLDRSG